MRERSSRRAFRARDQLTDLVQWPTTKDLYDLMHISSCNVVYNAEKWDPKWTFCPVCGRTMDNDGNIAHESRRDADCLT